MSWLEYMGVLIALIVATYLGQFLNTWYLGRSAHPARWVVPVGLLAAIVALLGISFLTSPPVSAVFFVTAILGVFVLLGAWVDLRRTPREFPGSPAGDV